MGNDINRIKVIKICQLTPLLIAVLVLNACDTINAYRKGGSANNGSTVKEDLGAEARIKANDIRQRALDVQGLLANASASLKANNLDDAKESYEALNKLEPGNLRAAEGLRRVALMEKHQDLLEQAQSLMGESDIDNDKAAALLRKILAENPTNQLASNEYHDLAERRAAKQAEASHKKLSYEKPVSLTFRDAPLKMIIEAIAKTTGTNIILDKDLLSSQKVTLFVNDVSLQDAINVLAQSNQLLVKVLSNKSVLLYPNTENKKNEYKDFFVRSFYLEYADPKVVAGMLRTMLGIKQVQTDDRLPMVMVKDDQEMMMLTEKMVASLDIPDPEVMLEFEVLEIRYSKSLDIGASWPQQLTLIPPAIGSASTVDKATLTLANLLNINKSNISVSPNPSVSLGATDANVNLLANPRLRVKNKEKAKIHIGDRIPVITSTLTSTGVTTENVQYIDIGLKLEAEPLISLGGDVTIKLNLDVGSLGTQTTTRNGSVVFQIGTRSTSTELRLRDGETQILAGLISDEDRKNIAKVPGLGSIPLLGYLFSNHSDTNIKNEIILSVTPHIIRDRRVLSAETIDYAVGGTLQVGLTLKTPGSANGESAQLVPATNTVTGGSRDASRINPIEGGLLPNRSESQSKILQEQKAQQKNLITPLPLELSTPLKNEPANSIPADE
ncbi:MAG: secretin N-terminal domain-containing protein [Methylotenera sp.]